MIDINDYSDRLERFKSNISKLRYSRLALKFLDHLDVFGLSQGRIVKYAEHLPLLLRIMDFNPKKAKERRRRESRCLDKQSAIQGVAKAQLQACIQKKFIQYAKVKCCSRIGPIPKEVSWINLRVKEKDSRVTPDSLLFKEEFEAIVKT